MTGKKQKQSSQKKAPGTTPEPQQTAAFTEIASLLTDDDPVELRGVDGPVWIPGYTRAERIEHLAGFLRTDFRRLRRPTRPFRNQPSGTPRQLEGLAKRAGKLGEDARKLLPVTYDYLFKSLDHLEFAARDRADWLRWMKSRGHPRPSGRSLRPETELLAYLDFELKEIPAKRRRTLMAALFRETLGVEVGNAEQIRQRLKDYRHKPGRSPKRRSGR